MCLGVKISFEGVYASFVDIFRESAMAAQARSPQRCLSSSAINAVWWNGECDRLNDDKLVAFREFRKNGTSNYENYLIFERVLKSICRDKKNRVLETIQFHALL
jgi:hypothetical protein